MDKIYKSDLFRASTAISPVSSNHSPPRFVIGLVRQLAYRLSNETACKSRKMRGRMLRILQFLSGNLS
jgi:hypothetical protein